jgi:putative N6-adenine-specific DNA methylase
VADKYLDIPGENTQSEYLVKTLSGLEDVLFAQMEELGLEKLRKTTRGVWFEGSMHDMMRASYSLRTALRVIMPIATFSAYDERRLYKKAKEVAWEDFMLLDQTFSIDANVRSEIFTHSHYAALLVKDAIVDRFREKFDQRPNIEISVPDWRIDLHIDDQEVTLSIDATGNSLHNRGYRLVAPGAPVNEVLAAGMVALSGWTVDKPLVDPMCGSGTILAEAYMYARNIAPQKYRRHFGFFCWPNYKEAEFNQIKAERDALENDVQPQLAGSDIQEERIASTKSTLAHLGCESADLRYGDFFKISPPSEDGVIITNPPYNIRVQVDDIVEFYQNIGTTLKHQWPGWNAWILAPEDGPFKQIGLKPDKKYPIHNGQLACKFQGYTLFKGKRKEKLASQE